MLTNNEAVYTQSDVPVGWRALSAADEGAGFRFRQLARAC